MRYYTIPTKKAKQNGSKLIGARLKYYRKMHRLTQAELAKKSQLALSTYQRYERGERLPPLDVLARIADVLRVSANALAYPNEFSSRPS